MLLKILILLVVVVIFDNMTMSSESIGMKVINLTGHPIELYWIDTISKKRSDFNLVKQSTKPIRNNSDIHINSYDTHEFMVQFLKHNDGDPEVSFVKGPREERITIKYDEETNTMTAAVKDDKDDIIDKTSEAAQECRQQYADDQESFTDCVSDILYDDLYHKTQSKYKMEHYRNKISRRLRKYACADLDLNTTKPVRDPFHIKIDGKDYAVHMLLEMDNAMIWTIEDFVTESECNVIVESGRPNLERATIADEDGKSIVSEHRKAYQATYELSAFDNTEPLWNLYQRTYSITNKIAKMDLPLDGQEEFTIIQYNKEDEYKSHCDGDCNNELHNLGGRVATAILYCIVPEKGGGTTFSRADIFVKPKKYMATFFTYKGKDGHMDEGYTEHSGCPVYEGEKWIATVWMREGVSADDPWTNFDPAGIRMIDETYLSPDPDAEEVPDEEE